MPAAQPLLVLWDIDRYAMAAPEADYLTAAGADVLVFSLADLALRLRRAA